MGYENIEKQEVTLKINFQFPLWDTLKALLSVARRYYTFQFPLWDTVMFEIILTDKYVLQLSIPFMGYIEEAKKKSEEIAKTFNSLYWIRYSSN